MINRIKSFALVHRPSIGVAAIIASLLLLGGICGYAISKMEANQNYQKIATSHSEELKRLEASHNHTVNYLASRVQELVILQVETAEELSKANRDLRRLKDEVHLLRN